MRRFGLALAGSLLTACGAGVGDGGIDASPPVDAIHLPDARPDAGPPGWCGESAGALDRSFNDVGVAFGPAIGDNHYATHIFVVDGGRILTIGPGQLDGASRITLIRFLADGSVDDSFGPGGIVFAGPEGGGSFDLLGADLDDDGRILVTANLLGTTPAIGRFLADGSPDTTFAGDGWADLPNLGLVYRVAAHTDGAIVAGQVWYPETASSDYVLHRVRADGALDTTFGDGGSIIDGLPGWTNNDVIRLIVDDVGGIWVAASLRQAWPTPPDRGIGVARYLSDGSPDTTFGDAGKAMDSNLFVESDTRDAELDSAGGIVVGGVFDRDDAVGYRFGAIRFTADGRLDTSFGAGGFAEHPESDAMYGPMAITGDGSIYLASFGNGPCDTQFRVVRFSSNGQFDPVFGDAGAAWGGIGRAETMTVQPDGAILVGGYGWPNGPAALTEVNRFLPR